jgi:hypothetical protein
VDRKVVVAVPIPAVLQGSGPQDDTRGKGAVRQESEVGAGKEAKAVAVGGLGERSESRVTKVEQRDADLNAGYGIAFRITVKFYTSR